MKWVQYQPLFVTVQIQFFTQKDVMCSKIMCFIQSKWRELSKPAKNRIKILTASVVSLTSLVFITVYNSGNIFEADEWIFWLFWQYVMLCCVLWCFLWCLEKLSIKKSKNEVLLCIYFSHLLLMVGFKVWIEREITLFWRKPDPFRDKRRKEEMCWMFLAATPVLVFVLTAGFVLFLKLRKCLQKSKCCSTRMNRQVRSRRLRGSKFSRFMKRISRLFVRTAPPTSEPVEAESIEAEEAEMTETEDVELALLMDLPPDYEEILLADLPNYESLNIKHFSLGRKLIIIDKSFKMTSFRVSDQV